MGVLEQHLKNKRTIVYNNVDTGILQIEPWGLVTAQVPFDVVIYFNAEPTNITITNLYDNTRIDITSVVLTTTSMYLYNNRAITDRTKFPGNVTFTAWKLQWQYYFTSSPMVNFEITYTINENTVTYPFTINNLKTIGPGDYLLANDERGIT